MAKARKHNPAVTTYADHDVIVPPNRLSRALGRSQEGSDDELIARADAALARLSKDFAAWMDIECDRLDEARRNLNESGLDRTHLNELFRAAHDIKGEAHTFGFPRVGEVADSLCRLIERLPEGATIPLPLVEQHVDAIRAIIREAPLENSDATAAELAARLRRVTNDYLAQGAGKETENEDRPDAPPLAPED